MRVLVISDLHISGPADPLYTSLLTLLRDKAQSGDILILAGDIFDLFIGAKPIFLHRYSEFLRELASAGARGVALHYIEGNHDFLIRRAFSKIPGMKIHPRKVTFEAGGRRFYIAHGDTINKRDYGYHVLRGFFRSPLMKALVAVLPGKWLDGIGKMSSDTSRGRKPVMLSESAHGSRLVELRKLYRSYAAERVAEGYDFVVMGHCHDLDEMHFTVDGRNGQYVNVGYPRVHGSFLSWSPDEPQIYREKLP
ncbi:UDP-2,3-diacylglucosamine diphosphatase [bacterium]|jgi:UDP-2,3-diacylglucosamine hydrolase|nr:UDP-2,3-diacylglucosamine diphosphatase [bacterium]